MSLTNHLTPETRLALLREGDRRRAWRSLGERRISLSCSQVFNGEQVRIATDGDGKHSLHCPGAECNAGPGEWFFYRSRASSNAVCSAVTEGEIDLSNL